MIEVLAAREVWCTPDETILLCHPLKAVPGKATYILYMVGGLDERGDKRFTASKVLGGIAGGAASLALDAISPPDGTEGTTRPSIPETIVSGPGRDCLAAAHLAQWQISGANEKRGHNLVWMLTSHRLGLLGFTDGSPTDGDGLFGDVKKVIGRFAGSADSEGEAREPASPPSPELVVHAELPRDAIASITPVVHKVKGEKNLAYLRIALADGSNIDITDSFDQRIVDRMLAMSHGQA